MQDKTQNKDQIQPRVFLLNYAGHDISDAERYGEVIPLTEGKVDIFRLDRLRYQILQTLEKAKFSEDRDFIAVSGSTVLGLVIGVVLVLLRCKKVNILIWDAKQQIYICRTITIKK